jgi:hypothetical protein
MYIVLGAVFWSWFDDENMTLLKEAKAEHHSLPAFLVATWILFAVKLIYCILFEGYKR